jgi:hypothetical protein
MYAVAGPLGVKVLMCVVAPAFRPEEVGLEVVKRASKYLRSPL